MEAFAQSLIQAGETTISNLLLGRYHELGMTNDELVVYLQYKRSLDRGIDFPDAQAVADVMGTTAAEIFNQLDQLLKKQLLVINSTTDADGKLHDQYDFTPLYERLAALPDSMSGVEAHQATIAAPTTTSARADVFNRIEVEFGRPLSPTELQTISRWFDEDQFKPELILLALREAVLNQAYNLRYIDRILLTWRQKNLTTAGQVERELGQHRKQLVANDMASNAKPTGPAIPIMKISEPTDPTPK